MSRESWLAVFLAAVLAACSTVPFTGRHQLVLMSEAQENRLGASAFHQLTFHSPILPDAGINRILSRVGQRIASAAAHPTYSWEFAAFDQPETVNAFALPGGKVGIYSGILPIARDEAGLAVIIGHEVAHAIARHGAERAAQTDLFQLGGAVLAVGLGTSPQTNVLLQAYGLGAQVGLLLPFSRSQESEADHIGLILAAKAGYDPGAAIGLWERMNARDRQGTPEFLSTHPAYGTRIGRIEGWLPEARSYLHGRPEVPEVLPAITGIRRSPVGDRALFAALQDINRLAASAGTHLLTTLSRNFGLEREALIDLQREMGLSPGGLTVFLAIRDATGVHPQAFMSVTQRSDSWPTVVRTLGAQPDRVATRLADVAAAVRARP